jgi:hypothetical protein
MASANWRNSDPAAAERALVTLGDNDCWGESPIILSRSFGEGLLARMTKDEARARIAFEAARAQQEKIVQAQPDYGPALARSHSRRWKKMSTTAVASFNTSPLQQRGPASRTLSCSNWKLGCALPRHRSC